MGTKLSIPSSSLPLVRARRAGDTVYTSGAIGVGNDGMIPDNFAEEARNTFQSLGQSLSEGGATFDDVVRVGIYISDQKYFPEMNEVYAEFFSGPNYPARSAIVTALAVPELRFELDAVAWLG
ncbi:MAG: RidA family protein [Canibacter sp.]